MQQTWCKACSAKGAYGVAVVNARGRRSLGASVSPPRIHAVPIRVPASSVSPTPPRCADALSTQPCRSCSHVAGNGALQSARPCVPCGAVPCATRAYGALHLQAASATDVSTSSNSSSTCHSGNHGARAVPEVQRSERLLCGGRGTALSIEGRSRDCCTERARTRPQRV